MNISWNTGSAAERFRLKNKKKIKQKNKAASDKARQDKIKRFDKALNNLVKQVRAASRKRQALKRVGPPIKNQGPSGQA